METATMQCDTVPWTNGTYRKVRMQCGGAGVDGTTRVDTMSSLLLVGFPFCWTDISAGWKDHHTLPPKESVGIDG
jgi:hypothetical protein